MSKRIVNGVGPAKKRGGAPYHALDVNGKRLCAQPKTIKWDWSRLQRTPSWTYMICCKKCSRLIPDNPPPGGPEKEK